MRKNLLYLNFSWLLYSIKSSDITGFFPIEFMKTTNLSDVSNVLKASINSFHSNIINKFPFLCYGFLSY